MLYFSFTCRVHYVLCLLHFSLQYFTSSHTFSHFLRQLKLRLQTGQIFKGKSCFFMVFMVMKGAVEPPGDFSHYKIAWQMFVIAFAASPITVGTASLGVTVRRLLRYCWTIKCVNYVTILVNIRSGHRGKLSTFMELEKV